MSLTINHITHYLETIAPPHYQAEYDNTGLQVGDPTQPIKGILIALDPTEAVMKEAVNKGCNLIITHHPLIFHPIKQVTPNHPTTYMIMYAIQHQLTLYTIHTNLDHISKGINHQLGKQLKLHNLRILAPLPNTHHLLTTYLPPHHLDNVRNALFDAGAGTIHPYEACTFTSLGHSTFKPTTTANPHTGNKEKINTIEEACLRLLVPSHHKDQVITALTETHPYEKPIYHLQPIHQHQNTLGAGMIGDLPQPIPSKHFPQYVKEKLQLAQLRHTNPTQDTIHRVALCSGSGSTLLNNAHKAQAHALITADIKYHQFLDAKDKLMLLDIGHYESEISFKELIHKFLSAKFHNIAPIECNTNTNPIQYQ